MSTDDRLIIRSPLAPGQYQLDMSLQIYGPDIRTGMISFIENFGQVYHGKITQQAWTTKYLDEKKTMLTDMWGPCDNSVVTDDIDFKLELITLARTVQHWNFPVLLEVRDKAIRWINGHSRLLASSLCWSRAWDKVDFLLFVPHGQDISSVRTSFQNLDRIADDTQLRTVLGARMSNDEPWLINAGFETDARQIVFRLRSIQDYADRTGRGDLSESGKNFMKWQSWLADHAAADLVINISVDKITTITDSSGRWKINHLGLPPDQLVSCAQMSSRIFTQKKNHDGSSAWHLYHFGDEQLDLSDFFFYVDREHSVLHTEDWRTILVQPGDCFNCKEISLSRFYSTKHNAAL